MSETDCRYYERKFPEIEDLVMVQVTRIEEHGAYVSLLEYDYMEGLILVSELSKRRIRSISKLVRVGQIQCCAVLRVEKGNVDLSKKKVRTEEARLFEAKFANAKAVHSIMRHIATHHNLSVHAICESVSWPVSCSYILFAFSSIGSLTVHTRLSAVWRQGEGMMFCGSLLITT